MRSIHLCFQLHAVKRLGDFGRSGTYFVDDDDFQKANKEIYQPFFALLERNTQRYKQFRFSLMVSGAWLDLAEEYDQELIRRLKKLVSLKQVELIVEPYEHSLATFYSKDEMADQVQQHREKLKELFGVEGRIFALPELVYNNKIAKWAEDFGFAGMLAGGALEVLDWHSPNHVYEAAGCEYLRALFQNEHLTKMITKKSTPLLSEKTVKKDGNGEKKMVLSAQKFQKEVELDCLRGGQVDLYFDVQIFRDLQAVGVVGFFDELIRTWLDVPGNRFVGAVEACMLETPTEEISVVETMSRRGGKKQQGRTEWGAEKSGEFLPVLAQDFNMKIPAWLDQEAQRKMTDALYALRREILASEDQKLIRDFRRLTALDYQLAMQEDGLEDWRRILEDLKKRANEAKKAQAVEISRAYTKKHDRGDVDTVAVKFGGLEAKRPEVSSDAEVVEVKLGSSEKDKNPEIGEQDVSDDEEETEEVEQSIPVSVATKPTAEPMTKSVPKKGVRRIIRRLVIE